MSPDELVLFGVAYICITKQQKKKAGAMVQGLASKTSAVFPYQFAK